MSGRDASVKVELSRVEIRRLLKLLQKQPRTWALGRLIETLEQALKDKDDLDALAAAAALNPWADHDLGFER